MKEKIKIMTVFIFVLFLVFSINSQVTKATIDSNKVEASDSHICERKEDENIQFVAVSDKGEELIIFKDSENMNSIEGLESVQVGDEIKSTWTACE